MKFTYQATDFARARRKWQIGGSIGLLALAAPALHSAQRPTPGAIDQARLAAADADHDNWLGYGRTWDEQRFSPLEQINAGNVADLKLAWAVELDTNRGQEATPIVVDGVMYTSTAWSKVKAIDAATGRVLWSYDPQNIGAMGANACCDVVNRGVAVWKGKVFVGTIDGRLIAIDAATGREVWSQLTLDRSKPYTITGAPRVFKDKVVIGNSGAELGVRGYVSAYDTQTGKLVWRFYTVPGEPAKGPDKAASDEALATLAQPTRNGKWWELGGGGTVWDSMVYDRELDQLLIGVGNGSPWNHRARSAGKGDNLFLSSIVAVDPDTGKYRWHYQETPAETWDFTATQQITLADLTIAGKRRKVLMQAPKNGYFYVIDRTTGRPISAEAFVPQNWTTGIDRTTWRPIEIPAARYKDEPYTVYPSGIGAHAWMPMSYSPKTGLVYLPAMEVPLTMADAANGPRYLGRWNTGTGFGGPTKANAKDGNAQREGTGELIAWDPVAQKEVWRHQYDWPWNGGTLATAGNLVFQGDARGFFRAFSADKGKELWSFQARRGVMAGPVTYRVNGEQYVAVMAGYGGSMGMATMTPFMHNPPPPGLVMAFKIGGTAKLPATPETAPPPYPEVTDQFAPAQVADGAKWFGTFCAICHNGPVNPDLKRTPLLADRQAWQSVVIGGALQGNGMISFAKWITPAQAENIRGYLAGEATRMRSAAK